MYSRTITTGRTWCGTNYLNPTFQESPVSAEPKLEYPGTEPQVSKIFEILINAPPSCSPSPMQPPKSIDVTCTVSTFPSAVWSYHTTPLITSAATALQAHTRAVSPSPMQPAAGM